MYKVIVVDDELWIRRGLINLIDWEGLDFTLVGESDDGEEAFELVRDVKPDVIIMDMRMPGMDGRELIRSLHQEFPYILSVVISGYSDFEYTHEAIKNKAFDYLLKPVKKDDLNQVLEKVKQELLSRDIQEAHEQTVYTYNDTLSISRLIFQGDQVSGEHSKRKDRESEHLIFSKNSSKLICIGQIDSFEYKDCRLKQAVLSLETAKQQLKHQLEKLEYDYELLINERVDKNEFVIIIYSNHLNKQTIKTWFENHQSEHKGEEIKMSFGLSQVVHQPSLLHEAYLCASEALKKKSITKSGLVLDGEFLDELTFLYPEEKEQVILLSLKSGHHENVLASFDQFCDYLVSNESSVGFMQKCFVILVHSIEKLLNVGESSMEQITGHGTMAFDDLIKKQNSIVSIKEVFNEILPRVTKHYQKGTNKQGAELVQVIIKSIETHYFMPLSLTKIAEEHFVNADHIARLFKKETGQNFVEYLTDYRIEKSKEMLCSGNYKNYEIAEMVGYENYRYFSQIFKKKTGMTIGDFKKTKKNNKAFPMQVRKAL
ncbi:response regulator transcription factor [Bacillus solitudinis]|uniref:response regulator transcription factor n=1 Tax=Bacillus solitudinis TaxID=2014074 RepID=UPI000C23C9B7|nr:response regulator [Bacillus solitudinis]